MTLSSFGLCSLINTPTRIVKNSSSCIDHAFYRFGSKQLLIIGDTVKFQVSDHLPILLTISIKGAWDQKGNNTSRNVSVVNYDIFNDLLQRQVWDNVHLSNCANDSMNKFLDIFKGCFERSKFAKQYNAKKLKIAPWMPFKLYLLVKLKNKLSNKLRKHPLNSQLVNRFDSKKHWKIVNSLVGEDSSRSDAISSILDVHSNLITNCLDICNLFNHHFTRSSSSLHGGSASHCYVKWRKENFIFQEITPEEVFLAIAGLNNKNSSGSDRINSKVLKQTALNTCYLLANIFNRSVITGVFPNI